jgi:hypothetical protein
MMISLFIKLINSIKNKDIIKIIFLIESLLNLKF